MASEKGYIGRISSNGSQIVDAPNQVKKTGKGKVTVGTDLREGGGKTKKDK